MLNDSLFGFLILGFIFLRLHECAISDDSELDDASSIEQTKRVRISRNIVNLISPSDLHRPSDAENLRLYEPILPKPRFERNTTDGLLGLRRFVKRHYVYPQLPFMKVKGHTEMSHRNNDELAFRYPYIKCPAITDLSAVKITKDMRQAGGHSSHMDAMNKIIHIFFPENSTYYFSWDRMVRDLTPYMGFCKMKSSLKNLVAQMDYVKSKLQTLVLFLKEMDSNDNDTCPIVTYIRFMAGLEDQFVSEPSVISSVIDSYMLLPIYTRIVNLKLALFTWATQFSQKLHLSIPDVLTVLDHRKRMVARAVDNVNRIAEAESILNPPKACNSFDSIYDCMMGVRTYIAANGLAYIPYWHNSVDPALYIISHNVVLYSKSYGQCTQDLVQEAISQYQFPPLTPALTTLSSGKVNMPYMLNQIKSIAVTYVKARKEQILMGSLDYEDGSRIHLGSDRSQTENSITEILHLNGSYIKMLLVTNKNSYVTSITVHLTDGRKKEFGQDESTEPERLYLKRHYIAGMFFGYLNRKDPYVSTLSVSFQLPPLHQSWVEEEDFETPDVKENDYTNVSST